MDGQDHQDRPGFPGVFPARLAFTPILLVALSLTVGCGLGVQIEKTSEDGRFVASVEEAPSLDPPRQSLWLAEAGEPPHKLLDLAEDQEACSWVVWSGAVRSDRSSESADLEPPSFVAFGIDPPRAVVVEAASRRIVFDQRLQDESPWTTDSRLGAFEWASDRSADTGWILRYQICRREDPVCPPESKPWSEVLVSSLRLGEDMTRRGQDSARTGLDS